MRLYAAMVILLFTAACQSTSPLPTLIPVQALPTEQPTNTPAPTLTPTPPFIPRTLATFPEDQAYIRMVNAFSPAHSVDIYAEGRGMALNLGYGQQTAPTGIEAGEYTLRILDAGSALHSVEPYIEEPIPVPGGSTLILVFHGTTEAPQISFLQETDEPLDANQSRLHVIHAIPGAEPITVQQLGQNLTSPIAYGELSNPVTLSSIAQSLFVARDTDSLLEYEENFRPRHAYTVILIPDANDPNQISTITYSERVEGRAHLRFINASEAFESVDVYMNGTLFSEKVTFGSATERVTVPASNYSLEVYYSGADPETDTPLVSNQFNANEDDRVGILLMGPGDTPRIARYEEDLSPVPPGYARMMFANALHIAIPTVMIDFVDATDPDVSLLAYRQISEPALIQEDAYNIAWTIVQDGEMGIQMQYIEGIEIEEGKSYLHILTTQDGEEPVMIIDEVGTNPNILLEDLPLTDEPKEPINVRFINAIDRPSQVDFLINGDPIARTINSKEFTMPIIFLDMPEGSVTVEVAGPNDGTPLSATDYEFRAGLDYTVVAYGPSIDRARLMVMVDPGSLISTDDFSNLRLINTSQTPISFRLGYKDASQPIIRPTLLPSDPNDPFGSNFSENRLPILPGTTNITADISSGMASLIGRVPTGPIELYVIDASRRAVAYTFPDLTLEPNKQYEVVAYQDSGSDEVMAFLLSYDAP